MASHDSHQLQVYFARREQPFIFTQPEPAHHFPASKVTIDGDVGTSPWKYAPLIRVYDEAHCIYHGVMKIPGEEGSAPERSVEVALKWVAGPIRIAYLREEADFYETNRGALQDIAPQYYGHFTAEVEGAKVACIVLEYCNGQPTHTVFEMK
ncbi:hypothetical protein TRAPUB_107 [Trametes pubescens]|uniref:Uncharacterized protein n=1 Tax=Trametes pubescens TaxID=154538 RepID=A0A1M2VN21_TRAPU|nr:hypothetical protein TRAPUB_107 [Trametes pubescens]